MSVRRYRDVSEMPDAVWHPKGSPRTFSGDPKDLGVCSPHLPAVLPAWGSQAPLGRSGGSAARAVESTELRAVPRTSPQQGRWRRRGYDRRERRTMSNVSQTESEVLRAARLRPPHPHITAPLIERSLTEDLGVAGDLTTETIVPPRARAAGVLAARKPGRIAGLVIAEQVFRRLDPDVQFEVLLPDGEDAEPGQGLARVSGNARSLLIGGTHRAQSSVPHVGRGNHHERCRQGDRPARRPTWCARARPRRGLRAVEKYAVRCGGGSNHRFGLDDAVLIKDNHVAYAGSVKAAVERARAGIGHMVKIELEVDTLDQLAEALELGVDAVLLDNMSNDQLREGRQDGQRACFDQRLRRNHPGNRARNRRHRDRHDVDRLDHALRTPRSISASISSSALRADTGLAVGSPHR